MRNSAAALLLRDTALEGHFWVKFSQKRDLLRRQTAKGTVYPKHKHRLGNSDRLDGSVHVFIWRFCKQFFFKAKNNSIAKPLRNCSLFCCGSLWLDAVFHLYDGYLCSDRLRVAPQLVRKCQSARMVRRGCAECILGRKLKKQPYHGGET